MQRGRSRGAGSGRFFVWQGFSLLILGAKLHLINAFGSDVPFGDQWDAEAPSYSELLKGALDPSRLVALHNEHRFLFTRLLVLNLFDLNGQWDPLLQMAVNAFIHALDIDVPLLGPLAPCGEKTPRRVLHCTRASSACGRLHGKTP